jgi:hypothetical protein
MVGVCAVVKFVRLAVTRAGFVLLAIVIVGFAAISWSLRRDRLQRYGRGRLDLQAALAVTRP